MRGASISLAFIALLLSACAHLNARTAESVEQVERRRFAAMVAQDIPALEPLLAEELSYGHSHGEIEDKTQFLETIRGGRLRYRSIDVQDLDVRLYQNLAIVTGRLSAEAQAGNQLVTLRLSFTDAYVNRDGRWQLIAWQSTRLP